MRWTTCGKLAALLWLTWLGAAAQPAPKSRLSKKDAVVTISTSLGDIQLLLFDDTPRHKANFLHRASRGYYDGTTFHRVIPHFMVQGGDPFSKDADPTNDGQGPAGSATIPAEILPTHRHDYGAVAAARQADVVNPTRASNASQFYIVENHQGTHFLDGQYTVFGQVVQGQDVLDKIAALPRDAHDRPLTDLKMTVTVEKLKRRKIAELYGGSY